MQQRKNKEVEIKNMKDKMKKFNISLKRAPEEDKEIEEGQQSKRMAEIFPELLKEMSPQIQKPSNPEHYK